MLTYCVYAPLSNRGTLNVYVVNYPLKYFAERIGGEPVQASVDKLKALGVDSLVFDPCGNVPDQGDFMTVMQRNVEDFRRAFDMSD